MNKNDFGTSRVRLRGRALTLCSMVRNTQYAHQVCCIRSNTHSFRGGSALLARRRFRAWGISQPRTEDYYEFNCAKLFLNGWANSAWKPYAILAFLTIEGVNERTMLGPARFATAVVFLGFIPLFWCVPCLCIMCCRCRRSSCRRRSPIKETAMTVLGTADTADLANAEKAAAKLRMRVSGTFAQLGWMCIALGLGPFLVFVNSGWFDSSRDFTAAAGQPFLYLIFIPPAMMFIYLAVSPTDTRNIKRIATFQIFFSLFWVMAWSVQAAANLGRGNHFGAATNLLFNLHWIYFLFPVWWPIVTGWCGHKVKTLPPRRQLQRLWFQQRGGSYAAGTPQHLELSGPHANGRLVAYVPRRRSLRWRASTRRKLLSLHDSHNRKKSRPVHSLARIAAVASSHRQFQRGQDVVSAACRSRLSRKPRCPTTSRTHRLERPFPPNLARWLPSSRIRGVTTGTRNTPASTSGRIRRRSLRPAEQSCCGLVQWH